MTTDNGQPKPLEFKTKPIPVRIDPGAWRAQFNEDATSAQIRAQVQAAAEEWLYNYLREIGVTPKS